MGTAFAPDRLGASIARRRRSANRSSSQRREMFTRLTLVVLGYVALSQAGWYFRLAPQVTLLWPPLGLSIAVLLVAGLRAFPVLVLADLVSGLLLPTPSLALPALTYPLLTVANTVAPLAAAWALMRCTDFHRSLDRVRDVVLFVTVAGVGASALSATIGATVESFAAFQGTRFASVWLTWFAGDVLGALVVGPFLLTWVARRGFDLRPARVAEASILFGLFVVVAVVDFVRTPPAGDQNPYVHAIFPFIMWAALRFGLRGATAANLIVCSVAVAATARSHGPFAHPTLSVSIFYLHAFATMLLLTSLLLGAVTSERSASQAAAERSAVELGAVLASITDAILVCDRDRRMTLMNPAAEALLRLPAGVTLQETIDRLDARSPSGAPLSADDLPLARALHGELAAETSLTVHPVGEARGIELRASAAPIVDGETIVGAVSVARDVTEHVALERMKDEFLSVAAHELKTPVTVQKAAAQALLRHGADDAMRWRLEAIVRGADRITRVIQDMLDVSQVHLGVLTLRLEDVDLVPLVRQAAADVADLTGPYDLRVAGDRSLVVRADRERLAQVCRTLLENAVIYSPGGGGVDVHVRASGDRGILSVADHGVGIPFDKQPRIFERFFRAHQGTSFDRGGVGMRLHLSREFAARQGGRMWFSSEPGRGSVFSIELPLAREATTRAAPVASGAEGP